MRIIFVGCFLLISVFGNFLSSQSSCFGQTQYADICRKQIEYANPNSQELLQANLKLTDALYYYDLESALIQAKDSYDLALKLGDKQAQAVCAIDSALITGWHLGKYESEPYFEQAKHLFDASAASPEYRVHYYSSLILFELFRNTGQADLSEYFRLNDVASKQCCDPYLEIHQNMLAVFNRVVIGGCLLSSPENVYSRSRIKELDAFFGLDDAKAVLAILDAWECEHGSEEYFKFVAEGLTHSRESKNRLYKMFALAVILEREAAQEDWIAADGILEECIELAEAHKSPPLVFDFVTHLAAVKKTAGDFAEAKTLIERAMGLQYFRTRSQSDRHALYQLAFDLYFAEGDVENIKKYAALLSSPDHMREVVESERNNQQLSEQIATLKRSNLTAQRQFTETHTNLQKQFIAANEKSQRTIRGLTHSLVMLSFLGLIAALYINKQRLTRVRKRLNDEQESGRQGRRIREGLELKLNRLQRMESLGLMAGGVAHDFNNLLVGVIGNAEILKLKSNDRDDFENERIDQIICSADKAASLSRQMLAYAGKQQINRKTIDLNSLLKDIEPVLRSNLGASMHLKSNYWGLPLVCEIDQTQIEQVVMNLVSNAVAASEEFGSISIRTGQEKIDEIDASLHGNRTEGGLFNYIEVQDTGIGIPGSEIERIFEPFFSDKPSGRGLGLAVVYGMINGHQGLIRTTSSVGKGSSFRILLPTALSNIKLEASPPIIEDVRPASEDLARSTILIVDDEAAVLDMTHQYLSLNGWPILTARDGVEALQQLEEHKDQIGVMLLDVVMEGMGAPEVLRELDERQISLPVILMSGYSHMQLGEFETESQVVSILEKPFRLDDLSAAIEKVTRFQDQNRSTPNRIGT